MNESELDLMRLQAVLDQAAEMNKMTQDVYVAYYNSLIAKGAPERLAHELTIDYHRIMTEGMMNARILSRMTGAGDDGPERPE